MGLKDAARLLESWIDLDAIPRGEDRLKAREDLTVETCRFLTRLSEDEASLTDWPEKFDPSERGFHAFHNGWNSAIDRCAAAAQESAAGASVAPNNPANDGRETSHQDRPKSFGPYNPSPLSSSGVLEGSGTRNSTRG